MLKNSDFLIDHNFRGRTQASMKITWGLSQDTTFALSGFPMRLEGAVGIDTDSCCANARIWSERVLGVFQHNRSIPTVGGRPRTFVLMEVETLGVARSLGWKVHMRRANGYREGTRSMRRCVYRKQLDLETLVCTRGPNFPISRLESRLMCPSCGNRSVTVVCEPPCNAQVGRQVRRGLG
jgi:hypothetical protein